MRASIRDTETYDGLVKQPGGGCFGVLKFHDFERFFMFKFPYDPDDNPEGSLDAAQIRECFNDLGRQIAFSYERYYKKKIDMGPKVCVVNVSEEKPPPKAKFCPYCGANDLKFVAKGVPRCRSCRAVFFLEFSRYMKSRMKIAFR